MDRSKEARRSQLMAELHEVDKRAWALANPRWRIDLGPVRLAARVSSQQFTRLFVAYTGLLALVGGGLTLYANDQVANLGAALLVGAIFSFAAFLTEVWSLTVEGERAAQRLIAGDEVAEELLQLRARSEQLWSALEKEPRDEE